MVSSITPPLPDPVDQLAKLIALPETDPDRDDQIQALSKSLLAQIEKSDSSNGRLLARLNLVICPVI